MQIAGDGFISVAGMRRALVLQTQLNDVLGLVVRAISSCHQALSKAAVISQDSAEDKQRIIACVVLARLLEIAEAVVLLARGGFSVEVTSTTRTFLEAYFLFGNVCKDPKFVPEYFATDMKTRLTLINQAAKHKGAPFAATNEYATPEIRTKLKEHIAEAQVEGLDAYKNASNVGCAGIYDSLYRIASAATHSSPRALADYVLESRDGTVLEVKRHPQLGDIGHRLLDVGGFLLNVRDAFDELLAEPASAEVALLRSQFAGVRIPES